MTEREAIAYIENCGWSSTRLGLGRTRELLRALGDPQKGLNIVHVAGSNGKGSACAMFDAIFRAAGYRTGLYISPYLQRFNERIQVDGVPIPGERLAELTERVRDIAEAMDDHPSQFELVTAIALEYYARERCDLVVLEVGMGGALDSTNAIDAPELAVITNIGLEHTEYLGNTLEEIAATKAGIIKPGCACVCYDGAPEVSEVVESVCHQREVPFFPVSFSRLRPLESGLAGQRFTWDGAALDLALPGPHQLHNAALVLTGIEVLRGRGWRLPEEAVKQGLRTVRWPARLEILRQSPLFLLDGGHNPQCAAALAESLRQLLPGQKVIFLAGVLADKDYPGILETLLPFAREVICVSPESPRRLPAAELAAFLEAKGCRAVSCESIPEGIDRALEASGGVRPVVSFGSLYLAGAVRTAFPQRCKAWLRAQGIRARDALSPGEREERSARAVERIAASPEFQKARTVLIYRAVRGELSLEGLPRHPAAAGKRFAYPVCGPDGTLRALVPRGSWLPGPFGIPEPDPADGEVLAPGDIDLVLCPCTAFDAHGTRLGMGGGYYDRYLPACENAAVFAAAFAVQELPDLPREAWDRPMDGIFTEKQQFLPPKAPERT